MSDQDLVSCTYGNNVVTERTYDTALERLLRVFTKLPGSPDSKLQDLRYHYDPVGNPMRIVDKLRGDAFAHNTLVPNTRSFAYDPRYRLTRAIGSRSREFADPYALPHPSPPTPSKGDRERYDLRYDYDEIGNFRRNQELTRGQLHYKADRIDLYNGTGREALDDDPTAGNWQYDDNGNCTRTPQHSAIAYGFDNQPVFVDMGGGTKVRDLRFGDQRSVRLLEKNGVNKVSLYIGPFEVHQRSGTGDTYTKITLQVSGVGRMAQVERVLAGSDSTSTALFFVHSDHLGSGHVLTDGSGDLLSQEEYLPYGRTADRRWERNRFRHLGVETDEETGLVMTGPRTLMTGVGRFLQPDPIRKAGVSPWVYASGNPISAMDPSGYQDENAVGVVSDQKRLLTRAAESMNSQLGEDSGVEFGVEKLSRGKFRLTQSGTPTDSDAAWVHGVESAIDGTLGRIEVSKFRKRDEAITGPVGDHNLEQYVPTKGTLSAAKEGILNQISSSLPEDAPDISWEHIGQSFDAIMARKTAIDSSELGGRLFINTSRGNDVGEILTHEIVLHAVWLESSFPSNLADHLDMGIGANAPIVGKKLFVEGQRPYMDPLASEAIDKYQTKWTNLYGLATGGSAQHNELLTKFWGWKKP